MTSIPKKRSDNFKEGEEQILISLVKKYQHIVESKKTDAVTNTEKNKTWITIQNEFNAICGGFKSAPALRTKFNNLKKTTRKKFAVEKRFQTCTGGGPPPPLPNISPAESQLRDIMSETLTGFSSQYDDDNVASNNTEEILIEYVDDTVGDSFEPTPSTSSQDCTEKENQDPTTNDWRSNTVGQVAKMSERLKIPEQQDSTSNDWSTYTPAQLKQKKSDKLKIPKSNMTIKDKISTWAMSKTDLVELQKKAFQEEHTLKMKHMEEKHQVFIELQREEWALKKKHLIELHQQSLKKCM